VIRASGLYHHERSAELRFGAWAKWKDVITLPPNQNLWDAKREYLFGRNTSINFNRPEAEDADVLLK
jgi:hypothetical protein